jgi:hypothetical protein
MATTISWFGAGATHAMDADLDWVADTIKVSLHTSTYTPNLDTDDFHNDATNELSASGNYTAGGESLANKSRSFETTSNQERLDADDLTWTALTPSAAFRYGVIYKDRGGASSADELIALIDFGADQNPGGNNFTITWNASGILALDVG